MDAQVRGGLAAEQGCAGFRFRVGQVGGRAVFEPVFHVPRAEEEFLRIKNGAFDVMPALFPALDRASFQRGGGVPHARLQHHVWLVVQVVEQKRRLLVEQRQVLFQSLRVNA